MQEPRVPSLGQKDPLEKETTTHASISAWEIPRGEPGGLQSMGSQLDMTKETGSLSPQEKLHRF